MKRCSSEGSNDHQGNSSCSLRSKICILDAFPPFGHRLASLIKISHSLPAEVSSAFYGVKLGSGCEL